MTKGCHALHAPQAKPFEFNKAVLDFKVIKGFEYYNCIHQKRLNCNVPTSEVAIPVFSPPI